MANTTNFNWDTPDDTDLVKDGAAAIRELGQDIDTSMADLLGGTSGQILSKASGTDMDFTWITPELGDITSITASTPLTGGGTSGDVTVGILDGTTSNKGAVQLSTSTSSTSTSLAATASAVKTAYDLADAAIAKSTLTTAGDVIYRNSTVPTRLGIGTAGQVLTVNSGATAPEWATPTSGGLTLLNGSGTTLSGSSVTISSISSGYKNLMIVLKNVTSTSDGSNLYINFNTSSSNTSWNSIRQNGTGSNVSGEGGAAAGVFWVMYGMGSGTSDRVKGNSVINVIDYTSTVSSFINWVSTAQNSTNPNLTVGAGTYDGTAAITSVTFAPDGGTLGGTAYVYGVK